MFFQLLTSKQNHPQYYKTQNRQSKREEHYRREFFNVLVHNDFRLHIY